MMKAKKVAKRYSQKATVSDYIYLLLFIAICIAFVSYLAQGLTLMYNSLIY